MQGAIKKLPNTAFAQLMALIHNRKEKINISSEPSRGVVSIDGIDFHFIREGSGMPILILGSATYYSRAFSQNLREYFELIFVDLRQFIPSYNPDKEELEEITLETFADDVESIRLSLDLKKIALVGHSMNAQIAIQYATKYPQHTSHLILVCGVPYTFSEFSEETENFWKRNASEKRKALFAQNLEPLEASLASEPPTRSFAVMFLANGPKVWREPSYDAQWLVEGIENSLIFNHIASIFPGRAEVRESLENLKMPVLVIHGRHDYAIPYPIWEDMLSGLDHITYHLLDESSHNPQIEHPILFDSLLVSWLSKH